MQELLDFIQAKIEDDTFISLTSSDDSYTADYWEIETTTNPAGDEVKIKAGKQKVFTL